MHSEVETSEAAHELEQGSWLDKWWPLFLILFGISFVLFLATFPQNQ